MAISEDGSEADLFILLIIRISLSSKCPVILFKNCLVFSIDCRINSPGPALSIFT